MDADALLKALSDSWRPSSVFNKRNAFGQPCPGFEVSHDKGPNHHGRGAVAVRLARVNLDGDGLDGLRRMFMTVRMAVVVGLQFNRRMAVAQLVGGARQVEG